MTKTYRPPYITLTHLWHHVCVHSLKFAAELLPLTFLTGFAVVGAIIADSRFGMYKTIVLVSVIFAGGSLIIAIGVIDSLYLPIQ